MPKSNMTIKKTVQKGLFLNFKFDDITGFIAGDIFIFILIYEYFLDIIIYK